MKLTKPPSPTNDLRFRIEQNEYIAHCTNIANILAAAFAKKDKDRKVLIDQYLEAVNTETEI